METNRKDDCITKERNKEKSIKETKKKSFQEQYQSMIERIEKLESHIQKSTIQKRRRAAFLLDTRPSYRSTHLRTFTFHYCSHNHFEYTNKHTNPHQKVMKGTKWTLVIEGKLLVPHIQKMDSIKKLEEKTIHKSFREDSKSKLPVSISSNNTKPLSNPSSLQQTSTSTSTPMNQEDQPMLFTHLFDKIEVSFQKVHYETNTNESSNNTDGSTSSIKIKKRKSVSTTPQPTLQSPKVLTWTRQRETMDDTTFYPTQDSHTFHAIYFEQNDDDIILPTTHNPTKDKSSDNDKTTVRKTYLKQETKDNETKIIAKISLYRRWLSTVEERYKPSSDFIRLLLSNFIPKDPFLEELNHTKNTIENQSSKSNIEKNARKKAKITISMNKKKHLKKTIPTSSQPTSSFDSNKSINDNTSIPTHNSFHIPQTLTMKEAISAIFIYIKDHNLQDRSDLSIINNDDVLTELFGCERIMFSKIQETLMKRELITLVTQDNVEPIRLTYIMTNKTAVPNPYWKKTNDKDIKNTQKKDNKVENTKDATISIDSKSTDEHATNNLSTLNDSPNQTKETKSSKRKGGSIKQMEVKTSSTVTNHEPDPLIFNINVDVPSTFHNKIMELLRRVKQRESEYTNSRTKAIKILQRSIASTNYNNNIYNSNTNDNPNIEKEEETFIRSKIDEIVSSQGEHEGIKRKYIKQNHIPILLALAKTAPIGSEARNSALIDARMSLLLDRLDYHTRVKKFCWDVVRACKNESI